MDSATPTREHAPETDYHRAAPLEQPLVLISTLLPPALLLLSFLGPTHLFSPPLVLPSLDAVFSPWDASHDKERQGARRPLQPDQASIASSHNSSSSSSFLPPLHHNPLSIVPTYSHELYAPSTLSVPAVSAAAVWRLFRGLEWVTEAGAPSEQLDSSASEGAFDFPSVLQGVADVLAAEAASKGVELVIGQVGAGSAPSPLATPAAPHGNSSSEAAPPLDAQKDTETRELLVRGDERVWSVALIWILHSILASADAGSTVEVHFVATLASAPAPSLSDARGSHDTILPTRSSIEKWWTVTLEILHTYSSDTATPLLAPRFTSPFAKSLFSFPKLKLGLGTADPASRSWVVEALLPGARPVLSPTDPSTLLERQRASLDYPGQEPSTDELKLFADKGLKGTRVLLHAGEQSTFAKHLTTNLAGWGMDVAHVPLDRGDDTDAGSTSGAETSWNKGRREAFGRYDSGFGGSTATDPNSPEPANSPLNKSASPDLHSPSGSSSGGIDPAAPQNLVIIDDDIQTLRRLLYTLRTQPAPTASTLMGKRPQLSSRRTRSSPHVRQLHQLPPMGPGWVIVHFASLSHYKVIKEIVQDALATCRAPNLPDVLVVPKPAGPRRIITALWTALKRPPVDPSLPPIATSPTSPGIQYWTPRLSPALANQQDFDSAAADALATRGSDTSPSGSVTKPRTPPLHFNGVAGPAGHPPSPLGKISDEQVSYFSCVADNLDGTTPSEGMVIQSPDGRPAIFFQPQHGRTRTSLGKERSRPMERDREAQDDAALEGTVTPPSRGTIATPHEIGLGGRRSTLSNGSSPIVTPAPDHHHHHTPHPLAPPDTPALTLDSFIAKSRGQSESTTPELPLSPGSESSSPTALAASRPSGSSLLQRTPSRTSTTTSPRPSAGRRGSTAAGSRRKNRKATGPPTVPPINVLIVEDNPINQTILSMFMKKKGIKYAVAKDGEEAVQKWKAGSFHLVLMDIQLPVKDGIEATRDIREMERANNIGTFITTPTSDSTSPPSSHTTTSPTSPLLSMPVIIVALTASSLQIDRVTALAAGCNDFLTKPVSLPWLQQKLLEWGSMAYLSGFSRGATSESSFTAESSAEFAKSRPAFSAGLNAKAKADEISAHLHIHPRPSSRSGSPARPPDLNLPAQPQPTLTISSPTPVLTPTTAPQPARLTMEAVAEVNQASAPDLDAVDNRLEDLKAQSRRPGPSPLSHGEPQPSLESVVAEGARLVAVGRSRANSATTDSFSRLDETP
ncbi:hypothetical protein RQP46_003092 [Phenoliferia psychrophenolica]